MPPHLSRSCDAGPQSGQVLPMPTASSLPPPPHGHTSGGAACGLLFCVRSAAHCAWPQALSSSICLAGAIRGAQGRVGSPPRALPPRPLPHPQPRGTAPAESAGSQLVPAHGCQNPSADGGPRPRPQRLPWPPRCLLLAHSGAAWGVHPGVPPAPSHTTSCAAGLRPGGGHSGSGLPSSHTVLGLVAQGGPACLLIPALKCVQSLRGSVCPAVA